MSQVDLAEEDARLPSRRRRWLHVVALLLVAYIVMAYLVIPFAWESYAHERPSFDDNPRITRTGDDHPGDPLNVALIGTEAEIQDIMKAADWYPAKALGIKSDLEIAEDTVFKRPDDEAPVSNLFLFGRKEDLAFEQPVGDNPRQRNHVRFWKTPKLTNEGRHIWIGSASYDERVGLSHTTGQITHHIAADVDAERDHLFKNLKQTGDLSDFYRIENFHSEKKGRNGGGDEWYTDGALDVGILKSPQKASAG
ncbi:MAG: LssY C-terminal domain-containing protein [Planctomycetaceae bacterium]